MGAEMCEYNTHDRDAWDRLFDSAPPAWTEAWKGAAPTEQMADGLAFLEELGASPVLDVGCGVGVWAIYLAQSGFDVCASDFSPAAIRFAEAWRDERKLAIDFAVAPLTQIPFAETRFHGAVASQILDNVSPDEMKLGVSALHASLERGGALLATFNPYLTAEQMAAFKSSDNPTREMTHIVYTDDELKRAFPGFELVRFKTYAQGPRSVFLIRT